MDDSYLKNLLVNPHKFAIVGASSNPERASNEIMIFLKDRGHEILPIHPIEDNIQGIPTLRNLDELNFPVDCVLIYLSRRNVLKQIEIAVRKGIPLIWLPLGITSDEGKELAQTNGIHFIEDSCPKIEWRRLNLGN